MTVSGRFPPDPVRAGLRGGGADGPDRGRDAPVPAHRELLAAVDRATAAAGGPAYRRIWLATAPAVNVSVPRIRHAVRDLLARQPPPLGPQAKDGVLLIVSELVTNAVRHAALLSPRITVEIALDPGRIRVAVADDHPHRPKALQPDHTSTGGRGLLLVKAVTAEAGGTCDVEHTATGGKVVWAVLPRTP